LPSFKLAKSARAEKLINVPENDKDVPENDKLLAEVPRSVDPVLLRLHPPCPADFYNESPIGNLCGGERIISRRDVARLIR